jgi:hypothetical protein
MKPKAIELNAQTKRIRDLIQKALNLSDPFSQTEERIKPSVELLGIIRGIEAEFEGIDWHYYNAPGFQRMIQARR